MAVFVNFASRTALLDIEGMGVSTVDKILQLREHEFVTEEVYRGIPNAPAKCISHMDFGRDRPTRSRHTEDDEEGASDGEGEEDSQDPGDLQQQLHEELQRKVSAKIDSRPSRANSNAVKGRNTVNSDPQQETIVYTRKPKIHSSPALRQENQNQDGTPKTTYRQISQQRQPQQLQDHQDLERQQRQPQQMYDNHNPDRQYRQHHQMYDNPDPELQNRQNRQNHQLYDNHDHERLHRQNNQLYYDQQLQYNLQEARQGQHQGQPQQLHYNQPVARIPPMPKSIYFDGSNPEDFENFWAKFNRFFNTHRIEDIETIIWHLTTCLGKKASHYLEGILTRQVFNTTAELRKTLKERFGDNDLPVVRLNNFRQAKQFQGEHAKDFVERLWQLVNKAYPDIRARASLEILVLDQFLQGLLNETLAQHLTLQNYPTVEDALNGKKVFDLTMSRRRNPNRPMESYGEQTLDRTTYQQQETRVEPLQMVSNPMRTETANIRAVRYSHEEGESTEKRLRQTEKQLSKAMELLEKAEQERKNLSLKLTEAALHRREDMLYLSSQMEGMRMQLTYLCENLPRTNDLNKPGNRKDSIERSQQRLSRPEIPSQSRSPSASRSPSSHRSPNRLEPRECLHCQSTQHASADCQTPYCRKCRKVGHHPRNCTQGKSVSFDQEKN